MKGFKNFELIEMANGATCLASGSSLFMDLEIESFKTFFSGLSADPLTKIQNGFKETRNNELLDLLTKYPVLGNRTFMDLLSSVPEEYLVDSPKLLTLKREVLQDLEHVSHNYKLFIENKLNEGLTLAEAQVESVRHFLNLDKNYSKSKIENVYIDEGVTPDDAKRIVELFELAGKLVPNKYKKSLPPIHLVIKPAQSHESFATSNKEVAVIVLSVKNSLIEQLALALHEYCHLIEKYNPEINIKTNEFIMSRIRGNQTTTLQKSAESYGKKFHPSHGHEQVYEGDFIDPYVGKAYGSLFETELIPTEALSVGAEAMMLQPLNFYFRDPEHFYLVYHMLKGDY